MRYLCTHLYYTTCRGAKLGQIQGGGVAEETKIDATTWVNF